MSLEIREAVSEELEKQKKITEKVMRKYPFDDSITDRNWKIVRTITDVSYVLMPKEKDVIFEETEINGNEAIIITPQNLNNNKDIILYIHGGGFVNGSAKRTKGYCSMIAKYSGCKVITIDYSLAPEKPYPSAVDDIYTSYKTILENNDCNIALMGESAGGNLCLALTIRLINNNEKLPANLILSSPVTDLTDSLKREYEIDDFIIKTNCIIPMQKIYVNDNDPYNPEVSPIYFDRFNIFPPTYIVCDYNETLRADSEYIYNKCLEEGVDVKLVLMKNAYHAFASVGTGSPETQQILEEICTFINNSFNK